MYKWKATLFFGSLIVGRLPHTRPFLLRRVEKKFILNFPPTSRKVHSDLKLWNKCTERRKDKTQFREAFSVGTRFWFPPLRSELRGESNYTNLPVEDILWLLPHSHQTMNKFAQFELIGGGSLPAIAFGTGTTFYDRGDEVAEVVVKGIRSGYRVRAGWISKV